MKHLIFTLFTAVSLSGCAVLSFSDNLPKAMLEQDDPEIVRAGAPAFLIILDALVKGDPGDEDFLLAASKLYGSYAGAFVNGEPERAKKLSSRAMDYARRAICAELDDLCVVLDKPFDDFAEVLAEYDNEDDLPFIYGLAGAWAGWIQANSEDWGAIAQLPKVKALIQHVLKLDESYDQGTAHIYMGVLETQLPPSVGGKPEQARAHFERAILLSEGKNLMAKVMYAKQYGRLLFEQELHDRLLNEVLKAETKAAGLTLANSLAQEQAAELLASSAEYFE
jgi:hypothetical protein